MTRPPSDRPDRPARFDPTWDDVLVSYGMMAAIPLLLWVVSRPVVGALSLAVGAGVVVGARRAYRLARSVRACRTVTADLGRRVHVTVTRECVCVELAA